jgi:ankyrin repeat protein
MWARLVIDRVLSRERRGWGWKKIEDEIYHISPELDALYQELIQDMDEGTASGKLIRWICFATQPLSLDELRWALIVDSDCAYTSLQRCESAEDYICDVDMMERRLKTLSHGLAEVVPSSNKRVVQFIHQSVRDFFFKTGISVLLDGLMPASEIDMVVGTAHYQLSRTCIRYLAMEEIARASHDGVRLRSEVPLLHYGRLTSEFPLLHYATTSWIAHVKESETKGISQDDLLNYFSWPSEDLVRLWSRICHKILLPYSSLLQPEGTSLVHIVSRYQLMGPLQLILQKAEQTSTDPDVKDIDGRTPLSWASESGHEDVVQLLLSTSKADIGVQDYYGRTPLWWAAASGSEAVFQLLLSTGKTDVNVQDIHGRTPLWWAAAHGSEAVVQLLLGTGKVDVDIKDCDSRTPLLKAAAIGSEAVVRLLLSTGKVDVDIKDNNGRTPLFWASYNGHDVIVKLLISENVVLASVDIAHGLTPLLGAAMKGHDGVMKLLLAKDKTLSKSKDALGRTPLSLASAYGHEAVVNLLLAIDDNDPTNTDAFGLTPLLLSAKRGHATVFNLILRKYEEKNITVESCIENIVVTRGSQLQDITCVFCILIVLNGAIYYQCTRCIFDYQYFNICQRCFARGLHCPDSVHRMARVTVEEF